MDNLNTRACAPAFDGTAALAAGAGRPRLVLIEGGGAERPVAPATRRPAPHSQALSLRQSALLVAVGVALVALVTLASLASDALRGRAIADALSGAPTETVVVQEGDSLWGIAEGRCPAGVGTADLVSWIEAENGLVGGLLTPGQRLVVPCSIG